MRGVSYWPLILGVALCAVSATVVVVSQQQFQSELGKLRQELDRRDVKPVACEPPPGASPPVMQFGDANQLRRIILDDLRSQVGGEESDETTRIIRSWFD